MSFGNNLKFLRKKNGKTQGELSAELKIGRTTIANYEVGVSEPNMETLQAFSRLFNISLDDLLSRNLEEDAKLNNGRIVTSMGVDLKSNRSGSYSSMPKVVTVDRDGKDNILYVPVKARAGYLLGYGDPEYVTTLPTFRLPGLSNATYRMFEVDGPSMSPNILNGDRVIAEWVEDLQEIVDNGVYVIVHTGGVAVKRILNRLKDGGKLLLKSDTIAHRYDYPTIEIDPADVNEVWSCKLKISSDFSEPTEVFHRLSDLENDMMEMKKKLGA